MDVPSTSRTARIRPTASNRRRRFVADVSDDDEEVVEEQPEAQVETVVSEQAEEVREQTSTAAINRTGEIPGGPTSLSLLPSFRTHIAASIWLQQVCE